MPCSPNIYNTQPKTHFKTLPHLWSTIKRTVLNRKCSFRFPDKHVHANSRIHMPCSGVSCGSEGWRAPCTSCTWSLHCPESSAGLSSPTPLSEKHMSTDKGRFPPRPPPQSSLCMTSLLFLLTETSSATSLEADLNVSFFCWNISMVSWNA